MQKLSDFLDLISILQIINDFEDVTPSIKSIKGMYYNYIKTNFTPWKEHKINIIFIEICKKEKLVDLYKRFVKQYLEITQKDDFFYLLQELFDTNEYKMFIKTFYSENLLLKEKLEDRFKFFYSLKIGKEPEKIGIDYNKINIIPNNFSTFSYAVLKDGILYFIAGEIAGLDELEYSGDKGISNDIFTFYILSQIFKFTFKIQEKIKYHSNLYKYLSEYCFISGDEDIASFFYLNCIYAYTIKFLNEVKMFNTERIQKLLFHKGFIASAFTNFIELQNNFLDVSKIIRYTRTKSFKKILDKNFTSQKFVKKTTKRADLYSFGQIKKINFPLKKILKESDCILLGEIHFCNNYYNFIGELLPFFVKYNYLNFYFELPASYSEIINNFFNNKISFPEDPLLLYLKVLFINLKKIKNETNKQINIFCFDINIDNQLKINNYNEFLINRENQIIKNLQKNLNNTGKNLFFLGKNHVFKQTNEFYKISKPCVGIFLNEFYKAQNKKLFSFVLESNVIEIRLFYNTSLKNKNAISENKTGLDLIAYIQKKYPNKVFIIDLSKNSNNLGWYEKDSSLFDGDISILKSEGYFIHEPINIYDGLIIFPEIRSRYD